MVCKWAARAFPEGKPYLRTGTFPGGRRPEDVVLESMESTNTANELVLSSAFLLATAYGALIALVFISQDLRELHHPEETSSPAAAITTNTGKIRTPSGVVSPLVAGGGNRGWRRAAVAAVISAAATIVGTGFAARRTSGSPTPPPTSPSASNGSSLLCCNWPGECP